MSTAHNIFFWGTLLFVLVWAFCALYIAREDDELELSFVEFHWDNLRGMCQFVASRFHLLPRKPKKRSRARPVARAKARTSRAKKSAARAA